LRNIIERAIVRHKREVDILGIEHIRAFLTNRLTPPWTAGHSAAVPSLLNDWQKRVRSLAVKIVDRSGGIDATQARTFVDQLFDATLPALWNATEAGRTPDGAGRPIPWPVWEDVWRCFAVAQLGGPAPAEKVLGIPANTLRQWISDRESK